MGALRVLRHRLYLAVYQSPRARLNLCDLAQSKQLARIKLDQRLSADAAFFHARPHPLISRGYNLARRQEGYCG